MSFGRKKTAWLGVANNSKKEETKRKKEKREADILCDTSAREQKCSLRVDESSSRRRSETKFYREREKTFLFFYDAEKGKRKTKESARVRFLFSF